MLKVIQPVSETAAKSETRKKSERITEEYRTYTNNHISIRFEYEKQAPNTGQRYRVYGRENWEIDENGQLEHREIRKNVMPFDEFGRNYF